MGREELATRHTATSRPEKSNPVSSPNQQKVRFRKAGPNGRPCLRGHEQRPERLPQLCSGVWGSPERWLQLMILPKTRPEPQGAERTYISVPKSFKLVPQRP